MVKKEEEQELAFIAARVEEIRRGLDRDLTEEQLQRPLSRRLVHALVASVTATTAAKVKALSARVEALEEGGVRYRGIFQRANSYSRGDMVTHSGSLWVALKAVPMGVAPGSDPVFWQLAAKGGKPVKLTPGGSKPA